MRFLPTLTIAAYGMCFTFIAIGAACLFIVPDWQSVGVILAVMAFFGFLALMIYKSPDPAKQAAMTIIDHDPDEFMPTWLKFAVFACTSVTLWGLAFAFQMLADYSLVLFAIACPLATILFVAASFAADRHQRR